MTRRIFVYSCGILSISTRLAADRKGSRHLSTEPGAGILPQAWGTLEGLVAASNPEHRKYAIAALETLAAYEKALHMMIDSLRLDKEPEVRAFAANTLGDGRVRRAIPALRIALDDGDARVVFAAAKALWDMGDRSGAGFFRQVLAGEVKQGPGLIQGAMDDARRKLHDPKALAMIGAKEVTGAFLGPASLAITFAQESLRDKGAAARALSAKSLGSDRSAASRKALIAALDDSSALVRVAACDALAIQGDRRNLSHIEPLLDEKNEAVQAMAAAAAIRLSEGRSHKR